MEIRTPDSMYRLEDWECYRGCTGYHENMRRAGDEVFNVLYQRMGNESPNRFSELAELYFGMPYDYKAFRGVTAYIARKAIKKGLCFVVAPILICTGDTYEMVVEDWEMALIEIGDLSISDRKGRVSWESLI